MSQKALLVGINKYKMANSDLSGCVNDVTNVRDSLLKFFGFKLEGIRVVTDERATKKAILERLEWLVKGAKAGDRLLFHFSGHGSQIRDRNGDELKDKLDEIICPHDMSWNGTYIVDDDLHKVFSGLPKGVVLEVLLDSCHSGTGTRELLALEKQPPEFSFKPRYLPPPADILCRVDDELPVHHLFKGLSPLNPSRKATNALPEYLSLFSGCRDNQTSADAQIDGKYNGAFTYYFCKHLRDVKGAISRAELLKRVRASLKHEEFDQVPQLETSKEKMGKKLLE
ncbi:MAG: caspase family protein [Deltaproteobacteria bacterium]|nr:caspase family protein [Deltaproteobacteria bacterium]